MSLVAYTAIYGGYDPLHPHPEHPGVDAWICYTDDPDLCADGWTTVVEPPRYQHPRMSAKWRKCHPPLEAEASIWLDGSVQVTDPTYVDMLADLIEPGAAEMAFFRHPQRDNIGDEARYSTGMRKYDGLPMIDQADRYMARRGDADRLGLWASTTFARRHTPRVLQMGAAWLAHCEMGTYQDQLSLPVLLADYGVRVAEIPGSLLANPWFVWDWGGHRSHE